MPQPENTNQPRDLSEHMPYAIKRRRLIFWRSLLIALVTTAGIAMFVIWYKAWPQKMDCYATAQKLAYALDKYRTKNNELPPLLEAVEIDGTRYSIDHYTYRLTGFGGPPAYPDGTVIAYCRSPHEGLFHNSGRHVLLFKNKRLRLVWMDEDEFRKYMKTQKDLTPF